MNTPPHKMVVLIPALNEEACIGAVIQDIKRQCDVQIVVIDDASTDRTAIVAREEGATVLPLTIRLGAWGAMRTGFRYAWQHGFDIVITMDADGQHMPEAIRDIAEPVLSGQADLAIGSCTDRGSLSRKLSWSFFQKLTGLEVRDLTSGFRAYSGTVLDTIMSGQTALLDYQDLGVLLAIRNSGFRMVEVPVGMCPRMNGPSRIFSSWIKVFRYLIITGIICLSKTRMPFRRVECQNTLP